jgi:hypothetical protein
LYGTGAAPRPGWQLTDSQPAPKGNDMNRSQHLRRLAGGLAALAGTLAALAAAAPPSSAMVPHPGAPAVAPAVRTIVAGGMPGWQITLIALGAALVAATAAVLLDRARARRRNRGAQTGRPAAGAVRPAASSRDASSRDARRADHVA